MNSGVEGRMAGEEVGCSTANDTSTYRDISSSRFSGGLDGFLYRRLRCFEAVVMILELE